jgi:hypothetical protein
MAAKKLSFDRKPAKDRKKKAGKAKPDPLAFNFGANVSVGKGGGRRGGPGGGS